MGQFINVKGEGIRSNKEWYQMTDKEKFIDICEGTFIRNPYGTNYFSDGSLTTILNLNTLRLRELSYDRIIK